MITGGIIQSAFCAEYELCKASTEYNREGVELKELIRELHDNQIEVILDVVFNHTAEGNECDRLFRLKDLTIRFIIC